MLYLWHTHKMYHMAICFNIIIYKLLKEYNDVIREVRILSHLKNGRQVLKGQTDEKLNFDG